MRRAFYFTEEVCAMLHITDKTLHRWCRKASPPIVPGRVPDQDARWHTYTPEQIERLAELHQRVINEDAAQRGAVRYPLSMRAALADYQEDIEQRLQSALDEVRRLRAEVIERREQRIPLPSFTEGAPQPASVHPPRPATPLYEHAYAGEHERLPASLVSLKSLCEAHGIPNSTGKHAAKDGRIECHHGTWLHHGGTVLYAFDAHQVRLFVAYYKRHDRFHPCPICETTDYHSSVEGASIAPVSW